jgi:hypothetical protein
VITLRDEFLSEEDPDLRTMTEPELYAYWDMWLRQAQATNDLDRHTYSHGVFSCAPEAAVDVTPELGAATPAPCQTTPAANTA